MQRLTSTIVLLAALLACSAPSAPGAPPREEEPAPSRPEGEFCVRGTVTDGEGLPVEAARVQVARGWGTLFPTATTTDAQGRYEIWFGPGFRMDDGVGLQCALVSASKPGCYERDLNRQGDLGMAYRQPPDGQGTFQDLVLPGHPYQVDFVLVSGASVRGRLVDPRGKPVPGRAVYLAGEAMPPGHSVLVSAETDSDGRFALEGIPPEPYRFQVQWSPRKEIESEPLELERAGEWELVLQCDAAADSLDVRVDAAPD